MDGRTPRGFPQRLVGRDVVIHRKYYAGSGSRTWQKPPVDDPASACVFVRVTGPGGGGGAGYNGVSHGGGGGGGGGAYSELAIPYLECPGTLAISIGAEGAGGAYSTADAGTDGANVTVTGGAWFVGAEGGKGGAVGLTVPSTPAAGGAGGRPLVASGFPCSVPGFDGGAGGDGYNSTAAEDGASSFRGGGGGGGGGKSGQPPGAGGASGSAGSGGVGGEGYGSAEATSGSVFGGGGGGGGANQDGYDGAPGLVEILVLRDWHAGAFSENF